MDPRFSVSRDELYNVQMEVKQVQYAQSSHAERILRLEKRQADDAALKSVWNSPFPGVLGGTPQQGKSSKTAHLVPTYLRSAYSDIVCPGPVQIPHNEMFDDLDERGEQLLGSLHLGPAEEEPARRGAASRANSVRFDESALQSSSWSAGNNRHSGEFGPVRPGSSLMMERSLSHKSDGRHSSAGHSVHSHHSVASGRASSLGIDTNATADDDDSSFDIPGPPVSLFVLGSVPSIVRCWLTTNYAHGTLLYADLCTGAQKSTVEYSLISELQLTDEIQKGGDGAYRVRLDVYFAEAVITQHGSRSNMREGSVPSMTVLFEVIGTEQPAQVGDGKGIRIFIGSDALRLYSADLLLSKNIMVLSGNEGERLRVPFVRPEDDAVFRHICTANMIPEKPRLNANAPAFVLGEAEQGTQEEPEELSSEPRDKDDASNGACSPSALQEHASVQDKAAEGISGHANGDGVDRDSNESDTGNRSVSNATESSRRESSTGIWGPWRHGPGGGSDGPQRETGSLSGYQPATRGGRHMKVLKPQKSSSSSARIGASYEPPLPSKPSGEGRRRSQVSAGGDGGINGGNRSDTKRAVSTSRDAKARSPNRENRSGGTLPRATNPVGVASAFSWMTPPAKAKASSTATE